MVAVIDKKELNSVGLVQTEFVSFYDKIKLECGINFGPVTVAYECYGKLNKAKDNAVLILHSLTENAHAAGYHSEDDKKAGWWDMMIGSGKAFDTDKYFVICSNVLGGCNGTTGPSSINPETGKCYGLSFPIVTIPDFVKVQKKLIDYLGIDKLHSVAGISMGGMQALEWAVSYPDMMKKLIVIGSTHRLSAYAISLHELGRQAIYLDSNWNNGNYYDKEPPFKGLSLARMIGMSSYSSQEALKDKFGRKLQNKQKLDYDFGINFQIESFLNYQGNKFKNEFDANSYLYLTKATDFYDVIEKYGSIENALSDCNADFYILPVSTDMLIQPRHSQEIVDALKSLDKNVTFKIIESNQGHNALFMEEEKLTKVLSEVYK
ncbi:MAG: homoserine O-acetyltransferase [bacterium]